MVGGKLLNSDVFLSGLVCDRMSYAYDFGGVEGKSDFFPFFFFSFHLSLSLSYMVKIMLKRKDVNFCLDSAVLGNCMYFSVGQGLFTNASFCSCQNSFCVCGG